MGAKTTQGFQTLVLFQLGREVTIPHRVFQINPKNLGALGNSLKFHGKLGLQFFMGLHYGTFSLTSVHNGFGISPEFKGSSCSIGKLGHQI